MLRPYIDYCHPTSNARRVRSLPAQSHFNSRGGGIVTQDGRRAAKAIDHDVEIAVAVEIGECHAVRDVRAEVEAPARARVFEGEIAAVSERHVGELERWVIEQHAPPVKPASARRPTAREVPQPILCIAVHD